MTHQTSFSQAEFRRQKEESPPQRFLAAMEEIIPWASLLAVLEPFYSEGERGPRPSDWSRMLRYISSRQCMVWPTKPLKTAIYDSQAGEEAFAEVVGFEPDAEFQERVASGTPSAPDQCGPNPLIAWLS